MTLVLVIVGTAALAVPAVSSWMLSPRLTPAHHARWSALSLVLGAATVETGLILHSLPTVAYLIGSSARPGDSVIAHVSPGGVVAGVVTALLATVVGWRVGCASIRLRRHRRLARADAWLGEHIFEGGHEVVVLPTEATMAYAIPGEPSQIVVSAGLVRRLPASLLDVVIRHERAHLHHRHDRFLRLATVVRHAFAWLPLAALSCQALSDAIERWADESAVTASGERRALDQALAMMMRSVPSASVDDRRRAMRHPPVASSRASLVTRGAVLALVLAPALVALGHWFSDASSLVAALTGP